MRQIVPFSIKIPTVNGTSILRHHNTQARAESGTIRPSKHQRILSQAQIYLKHSEGDAALTIQQLKATLQAGRAEALTCSTCTATGPTSPGPTPTGLPGRRNSRPSSPRRAARPFSSLSQSPTTTGRICTG